MTIINANTTKWELEKQARAVECTQMVPVGAKGTGTAKVECEFQ